MAQWQLWKLSLEIQEGMKGKIKFQTWWENKSLNKNTNLELKKKKKYCYMVRYLNDKHLPEHCQKRHIKTVGIFIQ